MKQIRNLAFFTITLALFLCISVGADFDKAPFAFAVIGDSGCGCTGQKRVADRMMDWYGKHPFNTVLMLGDNIYGGGVFGGGGGGKALFASRFDAYYKPFMDKGVKFYATLGNHDYEVNRAQDEVTDKQRFNILGEKGFYTFSPPVEIEGKPLIQFFVLNSVRMLIKDQDREQTTWLSKALTDSKAIWKVAYFHHPIYSPGGAHKAELELKENIEKILMAAGVQIVFSGHSHYYARMKPQNGITYVISGGGGKELKSPQRTPDTVSMARAFHFVFAEADKDKMELTALPDIGPAIDQFTLTPMAIPPTVQ
jgi:acid phosphatase